MKRGHLFGNNSDTTNLDTLKLGHVMSNALTGLLQAEKHILMMKSSFK